MARHKLIASNLANIDTPGYRTRDLDFRAELARVIWKRRERGVRMAQGQFELRVVYPGGAAGAGIDGASGWQ